MSRPESADAPPELPRFEDLFASGGNVQAPRVVEPDATDVVEVEVEGYDNVVTTGHATLDGLLHGGLAVGTTTLILTDGGDEGEMMIMHMAEGGPTTILLGDRSETCLRRAWSPFIDTSQLDCRFSIEDETNDRIIVENFSALCHEHGFAAAVRTLSMIIEDTLIEGRTAVVHCVRDAHTKAEIARLRSLMDGVIEVIDGTFLVVTKMRGLLVPIRPAGLRKSVDGLQIEAVQRVA